jgi:hypothetical protein
MCILTLVLAPVIYGVWQNGRPAPFHSGCVKPDGTNLCLPSTYTLPLRVKPVKVVKAVKVAEVVKAAKLVKAVKAAKVVKEPAGAVPRPCFGPSRARWVNVAAARLSQKKVAGVGPQAKFWRAVLLLSYVELLGHWRVAEAEAAVRRVWDAHYGSTCVGGVSDGSEKAEALGEEFVDALSAIAESAPPALWSSLFEKYHNGPGRRLVEELIQLDSVTYEVLK